MLRFARSSATQQLQTGISHPDVVRCKVKSG
jgi:hypothetical protein